MPKDIWLRGKTWYLNVWDPVEKKKIKKALGHNKRKAEEMAAQVRGKILAGELGIKVHRHAATLDEFIPRVLAEHFEGKAYYQSAVIALERFRRFTGNIRLSAVNKELLQRYVSALLKQTIPSPYRGKHAQSEKAREWAARKTRPISKTTVNRNVGIIKCMVNRAVEWGELDVNPLAGFRKFSEKDRIRKRFLHESELRGFLAAAKTLQDDSFYDLALIALYIGRRLGEMLNLQCKDYDREHGYIYLHKTKRGEADQVPVPPAAQEVLNRRIDGAVCPWIFPNRSKTGPLKNVSTAFKYVKARAGITDFRFHDLRHTAISYMVMAGVDYFTIAELAGHTTPTMIETRYGHLSPKHKQASSVLFGSYMDRLTGRAAPASSTSLESKQVPIVSQVAAMMRGGA